MARMIPRSPSVIARRLRRIARVLRRHGLLRGFWWLRGPRGLDFTAAAAPRWRAALEELGPTFVKFGQALSLRADLLPPEVTAELGRLQDRTAPFPGAEARAAVEAALDGPIERFFAAFDTEPLAAASIAQVHAAHLPDGRAVVVKVQRPGIRAVIESDLAILQALAALLEAALPEARLHQAQALVEEFSRSIRKELDFRAEARAQERFGAHFAGSTDVCVPQVHRELSGSRILVAERLEGRRITDVEGVPQPERSRLARVVNDCYLTQLFEHGIFHADPHPGNLVVLPDGRICFHDFGIVGRLSTAHRRALADLFRGVIQRDADRLLDVYLRVGSVGEEVRRDALRNDLDELIEEFVGLPLRDFSAGEILEHLVRLARSYRIRFPTSFFLLGKTVMMVESVTRQLDPSYDTMALLEERAATFGAVSLRGLASEAGRLVQGAEDLVAALPSALSAVARTMRAGRFDLRLRHEKLEEVESRIDRSFNRLTFGVVTAAIIVASSIIMQTGLPPRILGVPIFGLAGFFAAAVLGVGLLIAIVRGGRL
jgi:ubiquinone biosynthesis protein